MSAQGKGDGKGKGKGDGKKGGDPPWAFGQRIFREMKDLNFEKYMKY